MRHRDGQVNDNLILLGGLPDFQDLVTDFSRELGLGARKALGRILKGKMSLGLFSVFLAKARTQLRDLNDLLLGAAAKRFS